MKLHLITERRPGGGYRIVGEMTEEELAEQPEEWVARIEGQRMWETRAGGEPWGVVIVEVADADVERAIARTRHSL